MRALVLALLLVTPVQAQQACMMREALVALLHERYDETSVSMGLESTGRIVEVFASPDRSTWTIVVTTPEGVSCVISVGENWQTKVMPVKGQKT